MKVAFALALLVLLPMSHRVAAATDPEHYLDAFVDRGADPRDDFFRFAVGKWLKDHPIPANERAWGIDQAVQQETYARLLNINEDAAAQADRDPAGTSERRIGEFWRAAMDVDAVTAQALHPLEDEFARIEAIASRDALVREVARLHRMGADPLWNVFVFQDLKHSDRHGLYLYQGGLGVPNRDYYVDDDARSGIVDWRVEADRILATLALSRNAATPATHASDRSDR